MIDKISVRPMKPAMLPEMNRLFNAIFSDYFFRSMKLERDFAASYVPANHANALVALHGNKVVAHAVAKPADLKMEGAVLRWASFGNVMTLPDYRGRGIATRLNSMLWSKLKAEGVDGIYISGDRGLYTRAGATPCGAYVDFWGVEARISSSGLKVRRCTMADLPELLKLQAAEKTGFVRSQADFQSVLKDGVAFLSLASAWLISDRQGPLAWAVLRPSWAERKEKRPRQGAIVDYAGSRAVLVAGLDHCARKLGYRSLNFTVAAADRELRWILEQRGVKGHFQTDRGTQLILDPVRLLHRLRPYFAGRIGTKTATALRFRRNGEGFEFSFGSSRVPLQNTNELAVLLLGDEPRRWRTLLTARSRLADLLREVFPLPFPILGLNWN